MPYQLRQLLHQLEEVDRLAARFSPSGTPDEAADISHYFETTTRLGRRNERSSTAGAGLRTPASAGRKLAPADERVEARLTKFAARVSVLPLDEIFLGLAVASIVLLAEIGVLALLAN
jgi:hypothetical protein